MALVLLVYGCCLITGVTLLWVAGAVVYHVPSVDSTASFAVVAGLIVSVVFGITAPLAFLCVGVGLAPTDAAPPPRA